MNYREIQKRPGRRELGILAMAIMLHAAFLMLPIKRQLDATPADRIVEVNLLPAAASLPPTASAPESQPLAEPVEKEPPEPLPSEPEIPAPSIAVDEIQPGPTNPVLTVARLLDQMQRMEWKPPQATADREAIYRPLTSKLYARLKRPVLELEVNLFDELVIPVEVEIVDRWLEPNGTHRVVIHTPTGHTLCGRHEPVDLFRPWLQMPMMFHPCAGGGKR